MIVVEMPVASAKRFRREVGPRIDGGDLAVGNAIGWRLLTVAEGIGHAISIDPPDTLEFGGILFALD